MILITLNGKFPKKFVPNNKNDELNFTDSEKQLINPDQLISIVIPLYNEKDSIKKLICKIPNHYNYEIIVVNDGSTDGGQEKIETLNDRNIKLINHKKNRGYGQALMTGFKFSSGNIIVTLDSDGQHDPREIPKLIKPILKNECDLVIGSRYIGQCHYKLPLYTKVGEKAINIILFLLFRVKVGNNQSGFRAFNKNLINLFKQMHFKKWGFSTEFILKAGLKELDISEVPINVYKRQYGRSHLNLLDIFKSIILCVIFYSIRKYIDKLM